MRKMTQVFKSFIMLANSRVTGKFKYKDIFQLTPAPDHFPRPPYQEGHHPCILEIKYEFTPDAEKKLPDGSEYPEWLQRKNIEKKVIDEISNLFGVFSLSKFVDTLDKFSWTIGLDVNHPPIPEWRQLSYFATDHQSEIDNFTNLSVPPIDEIETSRIYNFGGRFFGSDFSIPNLFENILDAYYNLKQEEKNTFLRSAKLFNSALRIKSISPSISFACFVSSIESIVEHIHKGANVEICKECNAPRYSVTRKFKEFLKKYSSDSKELIDFYQRAYTKRSKILHAGSLFLGEHTPEDWGDEDWEKYHMNSGIERICRIAFFNWISETSTLSQPQI